MASILEAAKTTLADAANVNVTPAFRDLPLVEYEAVSSTNTMASVPRFGHSSNFSDLFILDSSEQLEGATTPQEDYVWGLVFVGGFILAFFTIWSVLLLAFKLWGCCCRSSIPGFLSGRPFTIDDEEEPTSDKIGGWEDRAKRVRATFVLCGVFLIIASILWFVEGVKKVDETRQVADGSLDNVRVLIDEASLLAQDLRDVGTSAIDLRDQLVVELGKDRLCPNDPNYLAQDEITKTIEDNAGDAIQWLEVLGEFATRDIKQMEDGLATANNVIDDIDVVVEAVAAEEGWAYLYFVPLLLYTPLMMLGACAAQKENGSVAYEFFLSHVVLPLFVVWIVASYLLCAGLALSASANADFCSGGSDKSPDSTIMLAVQNAGINETSIEFEIGRYYVRQCTSEARVDPFLFLRRHQEEITNAQDIVQELSRSLEKIDIDVLSFNCGRDFEPLSSSLDTMMAILSRLEEAAVDGLNILSCDRIAPIYTAVVYDGTCRYSVEGLTVMFGCLLAISICGMIMIMLRSAYLSSVILVEKDPTDPDSEFFDMHKMANHERAMERGRAEAIAAADDNLHHHFQVEGDDEDWKQQQQQQQAPPVVHQDTSDSGSVYTDGAEISIHQMDRNNSGSVEITRSGSSPFKPYEVEENEYYDQQGKIIPSAPYEHDLDLDQYKRQHYQQQQHDTPPSYQDAVAYKSHVY